jgi:hypothetical protein
MTCLQTRSVQIAGYLRIIAFTVMAAIMIFATFRGEAIAPHCPDIAPAGKLEMINKKNQSNIERKAANKVQKRKEHRQKRRQQKKRGEKPKRQKKPPKPNRQDKKNANKHKAKNIH